MLLSFILQEWQLLARQNPLLADGKISFSFSTVKDGLTL